MSAFFAIFAANARYLRTNFFPPLFKMFCMRMIVFYQKYISLHTCMYRPTCSQYTLESINNYGVILGICMGFWRILRCNPLSKGGYDPVPEKFWQVRWLI